MAQRTDDLDLSKHRAYRSKPWVEWTDGKAWEARLGADYDNPRSFVTSLRLRASRLGMRVLVELGPGTVRFQFVPR